MHDRETILSRTITHPNRIELAPHCQGVAVVVFYPNSEVLLVQQRHEDALYGRTPGQWNIVTEGQTETQETYERVRNTVQRAFWEELGRTPDDFQVLDGTYRETNSVYTRLMGYEYFYRCVAVVFVAHHSNKDPNILFRSHDGEIAQYAWVPLDHLDQYDIEYGARLVLEYYRNEFDT